MQINIKKRKTVNNLTLAIIYEEKVDILLIQNPKLELIQKKK